MSRPKVASEIDAEILPGVPLRAAARFVMIRRNRWIRMGCDPDLMETVLQNHSGRCEICEKVNRKRLTVDHDHATGRFRGFLCRPCNFMLGHAKDNVEILKRAIVYLSNA